MLHCLWYVGRDEGRHEAAFSCVCLETELKRRGGGDPATVGLRLKF